MVQVLKDKGIKRFFPIQYETFEHIYKGKDLIARDRTGSGKTLAFSLPVIERFRSIDAFKDGGRVKFLIVLPTREVSIFRVSWQSRSKLRFHLCAIGAIFRWWRCTGVVTSTSRCGRSETGVTLSCLRPVG